MKLNKETLKRIIKEELEAVMSEGPFDGMRFDTSRKQDVGSYGWDTLAPDAQAKKDAAFKKNQRSLQTGVDTANQMAAEDEEEKDIEAAVKHILNGKSIEYAMNQIGKNAEKDWEMAKEIKKRAKKISDRRKATKDKYAQEDANVQVGKQLRTKVYPFLKKNAGNLWKKSGASSKKEFLDGIEIIRKTDLEELGSGKFQEELSQLLGADLYDSVIKGRSFGQKLGRFLTKGSYSE